jgi:hypothetical protein
MSQKIAVVSFDHWNYDKYIVDALCKKGVDAFHIKIGGFKHKNIFAKISNAFSKVFLGKNPKIQKRQEHIINCLEKSGKQDQILVINPEIIELDYHLKIKKYTHKYICYLYDSVDRCPVEHLLNGVFDEIYSFDKEDIKKYGFKEITNYNYLEKQSKSNPAEIKNQILYVASFDNRLDTVLKLKVAFEKIKVSYRIIIVGKKTSLFKIRKLFSNATKGIDLQRKRINQEGLKKLYRETNILLDMVRENQSGLSFRIFEAMAFEKKIITNNKNVLHYNFYNPANICVIENDAFNFDTVFFETEYETLPENVFNQYTIDNWVVKVFGLN